MAERGLHLQASLLGAGQLRGAPVVQVARGMRPDGRGSPLLSGLAAGSDERKLQVGGLKTGAGGDALEHLRPDLVAVV